MEDTPDRGSPPRTEGRLIHWAFLYDLLLQVLFVGKERAFRNRVADLARLAPGESVLDVGCGTGTLAIVAKQRVGPRERSPGLKHGREADGEDQAEVLGPIPGPHLHGDEVRACPLGE
jgi:SAM-dependent methyltransferase